MCSRVSHEGPDVEPELNYVCPFCGNLEEHDKVSE